MNEVDHVVDRAMIDATDISVVRWEEGYGIGCPAPAIDAADRAAVDRAWHRVATLGQAARRLDSWSDRALEIWRTEASRDLEPQLRSLRDLAQAHRAGASAALAVIGAATDGRARLWATAELLALASLHAFRRGWGLSSVLSAASPVGERAWNSAITIERPERFAFKIVVDAGDLCFWTARGPDGERWDAVIDPYELPVPLALADRSAALVARHAEICDDGSYPEEFEEDLARIWRETRALLPQLGAALGPAYSVS